MNLTYFRQNPRHRNLAPVIILGVVALGVSAMSAQASSHREAPFITEQPKVDGTDFYMFKSYEPGREGFVTLISNWVPLQDAYGGPNYFALDPNALYEIHIDNNGNAEEDITFQFRFQNTLRDLPVPVNGQNISAPLMNIGPFGPEITTDSPLNVIETYDVRIVRGDRRQGFSSSGVITNVEGGSASFNKPADNIGNKSIPDYPTYADNHIYEIVIPGCENGRMFVGQRKESFVFNLGETFDLVNIENPLGPRDAEPNSLDDKNITSFILEVPISCLVGGSEPVIGGWMTSSLRQGRLINPTPTFDEPAREGGAWTQVSRLGIPVVNEVVIGLKDKNLFNSSKPENDAQFGAYVMNPTLPELLEILFGAAGVQAPNNFPRNDLVAAFLTGIEGVNQPAGVIGSEMLRLNTSTPHTPAEAQNSLGALGEDGAGFPNGRRPGDDVIDIELRVAMGVLCHAFPGTFGCVPADAPSGNMPFTDGAFVDASFFDTTFPYLRDPLPGSPNGPNGIEDNAP